jgi:hypothetical protein
MLTVDSEALYTALTVTKVKMQEELDRRVGHSDYSVRLTFWGSEHKSTPPYFEVHVTKSYSDISHARGKLLDEVFEETLRRMGFEERQALLVLEAPKALEPPEATVAEPAELPAASDAEAMESLA